MATRLNAMGIYTPLQLRDADPAILRERVGVVMQRMALELRGTPCHSLSLAIPDNKSILAPRSFCRAVTTRYELEEAITSHVSRAAEKLRRQNLVAGVVMVFVTTNRFKPDEPQFAAQRSVELPIGSADTRVLTRAAMLAAGHLWREGYRYKKAGVTLLDLSPASTVQGDLWSEPDSLKSRALMKTIDLINGTHGRETVRLAASDIRRGWKLRSEQRSPRFTTEWDEILCVR